jgi:preprotein translocase subunit SecG
MYVFLIVVHLLTAFVMIGAILLQSGKGAEIGATFGGSSQTIFGGRGATTFLAKFTVGAAIVFMLTSVSLSILSKQRSLGTSLKLPPAPAAKPSDLAAPATPSTEPAAGSAPAATSAAPTAGPTASSGTPSAPVAGSPSTPATPPAAP